MLKEDLHKIIDSLPDNKLESALSLLQVLRDDNPDHPLVEQVEVTENDDPLTRFLADLVGSVSAVFYDLENEAAKKNDPILEKRLKFSRKKISNSWDKYNVKSKQQSKK